MESDWSIELRVKQSGSEKTEELMVKDSTEKESICTGKRVRTLQYISMKRSHVSDQWREWGSRERGLQIENIKALYCIGGCNAVCSAVQCSANIRA